MTIFHKALTQLRNTVDKAEKENANNEKEIEKKKNEISKKEEKIKEMNQEKDIILKQISKIEDFLGE